MLSPNFQKSKVNFKSQLQNPACRQTGQLQKATSKSNFKKQLQKATSKINFKNQFQKSHATSFRVIFIKLRQHFYENCIENL